tara:strand:+ start:2843 stop:3139 length:297 start_codon:yes stop_codon:yes gene_type:complete
MNKDNDNKISETLDVIKKALNDNENSNEDKDVLILDKLVNQDGTIVTLKNDKKKLDESDINKIIEEKIEKTLDESLNNWLNSKMPSILKKHIKNKNEN